MNVAETIVWLEVIKLKDSEIQHWKDEAFMWNGKWQEKCSEVSELKRLHEKHDD